MESTKKDWRAGFTLIELMVVIVILGLLFSIVGSSVFSQGESAKIDTTKMQVKSIYEQVNLYMLRNRNRLPSWEDLITPDEKGHQYIEVEDPPVDPWGNQYSITTDPEFDTKPMVLSYGPDGQEGTEDDITNRSITKRDDN